MSALSSCLYCRSSVPYGSTPCHTCGSPLEWTALPDGFELVAPDGRTWTLERVLGQGGFGITYLARSGKQRTAIKECFPDGLVTRNARGEVIAKAGREQELATLEQRFLEEANLLKQLKHPVSTHFLASWQVNNTAYLMMEFLDGETLEARIARGAHLSEPEALRVLTSVLDLLEEVHARHLLHRDIKPANVMLTAQGVELIDFGSVAKFDPSRTTKITSRLLTPAYAPLELYGANVRLGPSSDLYSLAATVYEAMTGLRVPNALDRVNGTVVQPLEAVLHQVSRGFSKTVARALELRVDDRFSNAREMRAALPATPASPVVPATPVAPPSTVKPRSAAAVWFFGGMIALISTLVFMFSSTRPESNKISRLKDEFVQQQCEILEEASSTLGCSIMQGGGDDRVLGVYLYPTRDGKPLPGDSVQGLRNDWEFVDFMQETGAEAIKVFGVDGMQFRVIHNQRSGGDEFTYAVTRRNHEEHLNASQFLPSEYFGMRNTRARARARLQSARLKFDVLLEREFGVPRPLGRAGVEVKEVFWEDAGTRVSLFISHPGREVDVQVLARDSSFRLALRDLMVRFYRALPNLDYLAVFVGEDRDNAGGEWSVSTSGEERQQLAQASDQQLDDVWSFSSDDPIPVNATQDLSINAWVLPVRTFVHRTGKYELQRMGVLRARSKYGFSDTVYPPDEYTVQDEPGLAPTTALMGNTRLWSPKDNLWNPKDKRRQRDPIGFFVWYPPEHHRSGFYKVSPRLPYNPTPSDPPEELLLRLTPNRDGVVLEWPWKPWDRTYWIEVTSEKGLHQELVNAPKTLADPRKHLKAVVPFNVFGTRNMIQLTALNFDDAFLNQKSVLGHDYDPPRARELQAARLEVGPITRAQLVGLTAKAQLRFSSVQQGVVSPP